MKPKTQSLVAKYLEKIALEKGLVAPETQHVKVSEAAAKIKKLTPSEDFNQNVIKLCNALREKGFSKYADDVESKFLQFKKAQYNTIKETGEDLINSAHPKETVKMDGMEGDSTIEGILTRHKKMQQVVDKKPTGKLAAKDALNITRIILAQQTSDIEEQKANVFAKVNEAVGTVNKAIDDMLDIASSKSHFDPNIGDLFSHPWTTIKQHKSMLIGYLGLPGIITAGILQFFNKYRSSLTDLKEQLAEDVKDYGAEHSKDNLTAIIQRVGSLKQLINEMPDDSPEMKKNILTRIDSASNELQQALDLFGKLGVPFAQTAPQPTTVADPTATKITALFDKVNAAADGKKMTPQQRDQILTALYKIKQDLNNPQKAPAAKQALDRIEQQLTTRNLV